jgi:hypothetical protein
MLLDIQIAKKATVQSRVLIAKMDWWQKVIQFNFFVLFLATELQGYLHPFLSVDDLVAQ